MLGSRPSIPDPVAGTIQLPYWLMKIKNEQAVRRMLFIKQLGLKAYIDFPGAMHTRYSHALGAMHLAGRVSDILADKMLKSNREGSSVLRKNKGNLMAAGFLHDIGHGPFSHTVDFVLRKLNQKSHEDWTKIIIQTKIPEEVEFGGEVNRRRVVEIIDKTHKYRFLSDIIDSPLDVDKLDYLLRDAHHVGLKYSFDLYHFLSTYAVIGDTNELERCRLGLENSLQAIVTGELFVVIWKSMYDLVYHIQDSRIAEKMLEKTILINKDESDVKEYFSNHEKFLELEDEKLLDILASKGGRSAELIHNIRIGNVYSCLNPGLRLDVEHFSVKGPGLIDKMRKQADSVSDNLSLNMSRILGVSDYDLICDIVTSRKPGDINIETSKDSNEPDFLAAHTKVVGAIESLSDVKIYAKKSVKLPSTKEVEGTLKKMIESGGEELFA